MKRQGAHSETNGSPKPLPRMQQQDFGAKYGSISAEGDLLRKSAKVEWLWQLERQTASPALSGIPSYNEVLGRQSVDRSYNPFQPSSSSHHLKEEKEACEEQQPNPPLGSRHELDMEVGYEDERPMLSTFESIDHNFSEKLKKLDEQQRDAEDAEHTRHLERIIEINKEYREKRSSLRAQQAEQRRQFLEKEAGEQLQHYRYKHQPRSSADFIPGFRQDSQETGYYSYRPPPSSTMTPLHHHHPDHGSDVNELYRERYPLLLPVSRTEPGIETATPHHQTQTQTQVKEGRVPLPPGRVYNNNTKATPSRNP